MSHNLGGARPQSARRPNTRMRRLGAVSAGVAGVLLLSVAAPAVAATDAPASRLATLQPFSVGAPSNVPMGSGVVFESATEPRTSALLTGTPTINSSGWSIAVATAQVWDPLVTLTNTSTGQVRSIRMPTGAQVTTGTDKAMTVVQPDGYTAFEAYKMTQVSPTAWSSTRVVQTDLRSDGLAGGTRAAGVSQLVGLIRTEEVAAAKIPHTLAVSIPDSMLKSGPVWPARTQDSNAATSYRGSIPMGTMLGIPPSVNLASLGLSAEGMALGTALQDYGAHVVDRSETVALYAEPLSNQAAVTRMRVDYRKLFLQLRVVTNNSATNISGGGTRRQPVATDLAVPAGDGTSSGGGAPQADQYVAIAPRRVLDSRSGLGSLIASSGAPTSAGRLTPNTAYTFDYGSANLPAAAAYAFNVTAIGSDGPGNLAVAPGCDANGYLSAGAPGTSLVNFQPGKDVANFVIVRNALAVGCSFLTIYSASATVAVAIDVAGFYPTTAGISPVVPARVVDSRTGLGGVKAAIPAGESRSYQIGGVGGVPANATSVALNVTVVYPSGAGNMSVRPDSTAGSDTSNINYIARQDKSAFVVVNLSASGRISVRSAGSSAQVVIDVFAYYTTASTMVTRAPVRILDTRTSSPLAPNADRSIAVGGLAGIPADAGAVLVSVTGIANGLSTGQGNLRLFPTGGAMPDVSVLNYISNCTDVANFAIVKLGANGEITMHSDGSQIDVAVDVLGYVPAAR